MIEKYHKGIGNRTDLLIHIFKTVLSISGDCPIKFMARIKKNYKYPVQENERRHMSCQLQQAVSTHFWP